MDSPVHRPHLKRLELQGFKTFANRTAFDFSPGITAIVGPNGSGKSNVADALRWVLGEAASRLLRVRRTEEVIFAGNPQKAPAATAEVSLTIDNDGWLPLESAPVTITRRAHRPADGEIFINSRRARLRDLQELPEAWDRGWWTGSWPRIPRSGGPSLRRPSAYNATG